MIFFLTSIYKLKFKLNLNFFNSWKFDKSGFALLYFGFSEITTFNKRLYLTIFYSLSFNKKKSASESEI